MRTSTIRSAAIGAAVGIGFLAVGSARADDNSSTICVADHRRRPLRPQPGTAAAPTTAAAAPTTAAAAASPTTAPAATTTAAAPTTSGRTDDRGGRRRRRVRSDQARPVQQFQAALVPVIGPTTDIGSELVPLGLHGPGRDPDA